MKNKNGYMVISMVLILLFVTAGISATLSFLVGTNSKTSQTLNNDLQTFFDVNSCLEQALLQLKQDNAFAGAAVKLPTGNCQLNVTKEDVDYKIEARFEGSASNRQLLEATVKLQDAKLQISSWAQKPFVVN